MKESLIFTHTTEAFSSYITLCITTGLVVTLPLAFLQVYLFVRPGLFEHEDRATWGPVAVIATAGLLPAVYLWHTYVRPFVYKFFLSFAQCRPGPAAPYADAERS